MTREEFISKLPDLNMKDAVIRLVDQGVDIYGFQTEEKIGKWYEDCSNLLAESSGFLPVFQQAIANRLDTARFLLYTHVVADRNDFFIMHKADLVLQKIKDFLCSEDAQKLKLMQITDKLILKAIALNYYWFYDHRKDYLDQMVAECRDEIAFREVLGHLIVNNPKTGKQNHINGIRIDINKGRGHYAELNSDRTLKLFEEVILQQFYDRFSQSALTIEELKKQIKVYKLADKKRALRTMHEMYKAFVDNGYLSFNNDKDLYMLGQKNHKYVSTNNGVTDWIYAVFAYLSKRYAVDTTEDERRKTVRDNLKGYTKVYHQDDAIFPVYDFEHLKRVYVASDINEDAGIS